MKKPEIIYKRKGIRSPILWEKIYYCNDLIDESLDSNGKETGNWQGVAFLYRFLILQGAVKNRFLIESLIESYAGKTEKEMVGALKKLVESKEEWVLKDQHYKNADFFPDEVNQKLLEFSLNKYVREIS